MKSCEDTLYNFLHRAGFNVKVRRREHFFNAQVEMCCCVDFAANTLNTACYPLSHEALVSFQASTPEEARELLMKTMEEVNPSEISFTERAAMRTQCRKLAKFMKVR